MNKVMGAALAVAGLMAGMHTAHAAPESGAYVGGQYNFLSYKEDGFSSLSPKAIALQGGWNFNKNFAVEARFGFSTGSDSVTDTSFGPPVKVEFEIKNYISVLGRANLPLSDMFSLYGVAGFTSGKAEVTATAGNVAVTDSGTDSSFAFAVGAEMTFASKHGVSLEWGRLLSGDGYDLDAVTLGYRYHF